MITCPACSKTFKVNTGISGHMRHCTVTHEQLFWLHVDKNGPNGCWLWTRYRQRQGYGWVCVQQKYYLAHRLAWEFVNGPVPEGLFVLHKCDNPPCVNPDHMFLGDHQANCDDKIRKGRMAVGEMTKRTVLNAEKVKRIRVLRKRGLSYTRIGELVGCSDGCARAAVTTYWKHV